MAGVASTPAMIVVGAGLAGARAVETLRDEGFDGPVTLIGQESHLPYERPALSKEYLQGAAERESVFVHPAAWYADNDIDVRLGTAVAAVDPSGRELTLADGTRLDWSALLIATGSSPRRLSVAGAELAGVHYLRTIEDSDALRSAVGPTTRVVVVGGGWIGLEAAAAARNAEADVTVLERADLPLAQVLGPEVAAVFAQLHRDHGVDLRVGVDVVEIVGRSGRVAAVRTSDGDQIAADVVVVGVGAAPNTDLAQAAGLTVDNGIVVDAGLHASAPGVFAAGDVARAHNPFLERHIRVEHWDNALHQGPAAARSMVGHEVSYDRLPYFYTDQYDLGMEYTGHVGPDGYDHVVLRGDVPGLEFHALWLLEGRVVAGMAVNIWETIDEIQQVIRSRRTVDIERLRDPGIPIGEA